MKTQIHPTLPAEVIAMAERAAKLDNRSMANYLEVLIRRDNDQQIGRANRIDTVSQSFKKIHINKGITNVDFEETESLVDRTIENVHTNKGIAGTSDVVHVVEPIETPSSRPTNPHEGIAYSDMTPQQRQEFQEWRYQEEIREDDDELSPEQIEAQDNFRHQEMERMAKDGSWNQETI